MFLSFIPKKETRKKNLDVVYINQNCTELCEENKYGLAVMVFTDFGVLILGAGKKLLQNVYRALKPNGTFIFDVLSDTGIEMKVAEKSWGIGERGFWKDSLHLILSDIQRQ